MRITPDTNVLVRAAVPAHDDSIIQSAQAKAVLSAATMIAITLPTMCEFVWVLRSAYKYSRQETQRAVEILCSATTVTCDRQAVQAGLSALADGCDFADGVIAFSGAAMGGDAFVSFDRKAVRTAQRIGQEARLLGE